MALFDSAFDTRDTEQISPIDLQHWRQLLFTAIVEIPLEFFSFEIASVLASTLFLKLILLFRTFTQLHTTRQEAISTDITSKAFEFDALNNIYDRTINTLALAICAGVLQNAILPYFLLRTIVTLTAKYKTNREMRQQMDIIAGDRTTGKVDNKAILLVGTQANSAQVLKALKVDKHAPQKPIIILDDSTLTDKQNLEEFKENPGLLARLQRKLFSQSEVHFVLLYTKSDRNLWGKQGRFDSGLVSHLLLENPEKIHTNDDVKKYYHLDYIAYDSQNRIPERWSDRKYSDKQRLTTQKCFKRSNIAAHNLSAPGLLTKLWNHNTENKPHVHLHLASLAHIYTNEFVQETKALFSQLKFLAESENWNQVCKQQEIPSAFTEIMKVVNDKSRDHFMRLCEIQRLAITEESSYWKSSKSYQLFDILSNLLPRKLPQETVVSLKSPIEKMQNLLLSSDTHGKGHINRQP